MVIRSEAGTLFTAGDDAVTMHENKLWRFDNKKLHFVRNLGSASRTHLIFDVLPLEVTRQCAVEMKTYARAGPHERVP